MAYVAGGILPYEQVAGQSVTVRRSMPNVPYTLLRSGRWYLCHGPRLLRYDLDPLSPAGGQGRLAACVFKKTTKNGYPYVVMVLYMSAPSPIFTGLVEVLSPIP